MAYDQGAAYEPPRRQHYGQQAPQAPMNKQYRGHPQQHYDDYGQGYDQGYAYPQQQYGGYEQDMNGGYNQYNEHGGMQDGYAYDQQYDPAYEQRQPNGYHQGRGGPPPQPYGRGVPARGPPPPQTYGHPPQERHYDPRYQQRPGRNGYPPQDQGYGPRMPQNPPQNHYEQGHPPPVRNYDQRGDYSNGRGGYQGQPPTQRPDPRDGYAGPQGRGERFEQGPPMQDPRNGYAPQQPLHQAEPVAQQPSDPRDGFAEPRSRRERPDHQTQAPAAQQPPSQSSMPQAATIAEVPKKTSMEEWKANERAKLHAAANKPKFNAQDNAFPTFPAKKKEPRAGGHSAMSSLASDEQGRPSTSDSSHRHQERRLGTTGGSRQNPSPPQVQRQAQQPPRMNEGRQSEDRQPYYPQESLRQDMQQPLYDAQAMAPTQRQRPENEAFDERTARNRGGPPPAPVHAIDTRGLPRPGTADGYAMSPVRANPAAYANAEAPPQGRTYSPASQRARPPQADMNGGYDHGRVVREPKGSYDAAQHQRQPSLEDLYGDYLEPGPAPLPPAQPRDRDEEIEMEMPDFDSAAPKQSIAAHKRNQTIEKDLNVARPTLPHANLSKDSAQSLPMHQQRGYGHLHDAAVSSQPELRNINQQQGGTTGGFVFGIPGEQLPPQPQYDNARHSPAPRMINGYPPVKPPFAEDTRETRSMDGNRPMQMPVRGGPPPLHPQGFHPSGRGPLPPPHRPDFDRHPTAQTIMSDPGQQRMGSAPPLRQGLQEPPSHRPSPLGGPLEKVRSVPVAPQLQQQERRSNPDALPAHPVPVRQGLTQENAAQPAKPPPVRNYKNDSVSSTRQAPPETPVTHSELQSLLATIESTGSPKTSLLYAKKLVEASTVLVPDNPADPKTTLRNREKYLLDAHKRVKKLATQGYPDAMFYLADCYGQGALGLEVDTKEAFNLYQAAAKGGHAQAAYRTAVCCEMGPDEGGGTRRDYAKAMQWYRRAAALGDVAAMFKIGMVLLKGLLAQPRNVAESVTWLKRAAERADKDNPHALHELGLLYEPGNTNPDVRAKVAPDEKQALQLYQQAASLGFRLSEFRLGQAYEYGTLGLPINNKLSIRYYTLAAAKHEHQAELALSGWYLTGAEGILEHSEEQAYLWARKAAISEPPLAKAMFAMGYFSENGIGCPANLEDAKRWYGRAASYKFPKAVERLEEMRKGGGKKVGAANVNGKLTRKDQKRDEENCVVM